MTTELFPPTIDEMASAALRRLAEFINRSAGQQQRRMRDVWRRSPYGINAHET